jgi:peptidylprolyl isomerase
MRGKSTFGLIGLFLILLLVLAACGSTPAPGATEPAAETTTGEQPASAAGETGETMTTASGLQYVLIEDGQGPAPQVGDVVSVHYRGQLEDGTEFDNSFTRGEPIRFALGQGRVIPGWEEGIALMKEGGKARLIIPPDLAYGAAGAGGVIPPNATLTFEVELVSVEPGSPAAPTQVEPSDYTETETGLRYYDLQVGDGATAEAGKTVTVHYTGWLENGQKFDSSIDRGEPFALTVGEGRVIAGWEEGVAGMQVGGKRQLVVPPELGYGAAGAGSGVIPPNATLIFEIELLDVR